MQSADGMIHLLDLTREEFKAWLAQRGHPGYRAGQVWQWIFQRRAVGFEQMTDLPQALRAELAGQFLLDTTLVAAHRTADDGTEKLLLQLADGEQVECVLLRDDRGHHAVCISSQVGCAMGCVFCASGLNGVVRNLTTAEIVAQMLQLGRLLPPENRISHIVMMGMGEPLANLPHVLPALDMASRPDGLGISARRITISTVGLPAAIRRLAEQGCPYHLAVSLHAPNDELRNQLVPSNRKVGIGAILAAADEYFRLTGRRLMFEYVLLGGVNDQPEHARQLIQLLRNRSALLNLIPYNPVKGLPYETPSSRATARFVEILTEGGVNVKIRYRKGSRIDAACGQLRRLVAAAEGPVAPALGSGPA
jgi:23S rRNA (adenine2503-C2)-methyltransferase